MARKRKKKKRRERRLNNVQKPASKRPSKLRQWTDDGMVRALNAVQSGILGVNEAARDYKNTTDNIERQVVWASYSW